MNGASTAKDPVTLTTITFTMPNVQLSASMKNTRIVVTHYGGPDALRVVDEECPRPKRGEVRVRVRAAGVAMPDIMAREGIHPETPPVPYTPGWDLVGEVDRLGECVSGTELGETVAAMPIHGAYASFVCLPQRDLIPVPPGLDAAEAVSLVLNYITAYQMLHRSARAEARQRILIHGASGGVGTALLQLGRVAGLEMYGTCSPRNASAVSASSGKVTRLSTKAVARSRQRMEPCHAHRRAFEGECGVRPQEDMQPMPAWLGGVERS